MKTIKEISELKSHIQDDVLRAWAYRYGIFTLARDVYSVNIGEHEIWMDKTRVDLDYLRNLSECDKEILYEVIQWRFNVYPIEFDTEDVRFNF